MKLKQPPVPDTSLLNSSLRVGWKARGSNPPGGSKIKVLYAIRTIQKST